MCFARQLGPRRPRFGAAGPAPPYTQPVPDDLLEKHRLTVEHATAHALASAASLDEAAPRVLEAICESLGWEHGAYWTIDRSADLLRCANIWTLAGLTFPEFDSASCAATFPRGDGLPGRVWASGHPAWIPDVTKDANFPRAPVATREGLHAAFGFPVLLRGEVQGVLSFSAARSASRMNACCRHSRRSATKSACSSIVAGRRRSSIAFSTSRSTCCASPDSTATSNASIRRGTGSSATPNRSCSGVPLHGFRPSRRSQRDRRPGQDAQRRPRSDHVRKPLPAQGRDDSLGSSGHRRRSPPSRLSTARPGTSPSARRRKRPSGRSSASSSCPRAGPKTRRKRRARSSRT